MKNQAPYLWIPFQGIEEAASLRLQQSFPRPEEMMGEAWFMSETRKMYPELLERDFLSFSPSEIEKYIGEASSGVRCFPGTNSEPIWRQWFSYFLAQICTKRAMYNHLPLVTSLVSDFVTLYPDTEKLRTDDPQFLRDVLATLGRSLMESYWWSYAEIDLTRAKRGAWDQRFMSWEYYTPNKTFSSLMFLCWKYLEAEQIELWFHSVVEARAKGANKGSHWQMQLMFWLLEVKPILDGKETESGITHGNIDAMREAVKQRVTEELFLEWIEIFEKFNSAHTNFLNSAEQFADTFFK